MLTPLNATIRGMVNRKEILEQIRDKAAVVLQKPVQVQLGEPGGFGGDDLLKKLADTAKTLDNIVVKS